MYINLSILKNDPPTIKRFAQRQMYLGIDAITDRDLGFAMGSQSNSYYY